MRFPTWLAGLTCALGCGSGTPASVAPAAAPVPVVRAPAALPAPPPDAAGPAVAAAPSRLACPEGTTIAAAPAPAPTWRCARADGTPHGPFVTLFPDGSVAVRGAHADGRLEGSWERRHPGGTIAEAGAYVAGHKHGPWQQHAPDGALLGSYTLDAGTGVEVAWYDEGPPFRTTTLRAGAPHGPLEAFTPEGVRVLDLQFAHGAREGRQVVGAPRGVRLEETLVGGVPRARRTISVWGTLIAEAHHDRQGRLDGPYALWRTRKVPRVQGQYAAGKRVGPWVWTDRAGQRERAGSYVAGVEHGAWTEWVGGKLARTATYVHGRLHGEVVHHDRRGKALGRSTLTHGTGELRTFHGNGRPATRQVLRDGVPHGRYQELTPGGRVLVEGELRAGARHGTWTERGADGALVREQGWRAGRLHGVLRKYAAGALVLEATYADGRVHGPYTEYRAGVPALTGSFADDLRTGTWTQHDATGRAVRTATYRAGVLDGPWRALAGGGVTEGTLRAGRRTGPWRRTDPAGHVEVEAHPAPGTVGGP